jgi:triosephosphate isomerase
MKTYVMGNWKMNLTVGDSSIYLQRLLKKIKPSRGLEIIIAPSAISLPSLSLQLERNKSKIKLAAQNFYQKDFGAYTGEISIAQLRGVVSYALIGHSERRFIFGETNKDISQKVAAAIRSGITPILCIGETENQRNFGETVDVLRDELLGGLSEIDTEDVKKCLIAYEPVWAISTSKQARPATPDEIATSIKLIKEQLVDIYGQETADQIPLLYGGSVNPNNAGAYLTIPGINGVLVGESSLISDNFNEIIETAKRVRE